MFVPAANGFQFCGTEPGTATSEVLTTPGKLRITPAVVLSFKLPATKKLPKDLITPHLVNIGFLDTTKHLTTSSCTILVLKTILVVSVSVSVYIAY